MGSVVGPGLASDLQSDLNNDVCVQGVDYAADVGGAITGATNPAGSDCGKVRHITVPAYAQISANDKERQCHNGYSHRSGTALQWPLPSVATAKVQSAFTVRSIF